MGGRGVCLFEPFEQSDRGKRMSKSQDFGTILIKGGKSCPKCKEPMQRYIHGEKWEPLPGRNFYWYWDRCRPCKHFQNYAEAKSNGKYK